MEVGSLMSHDLHSVTFLSVAQWVEFTGRDALVYRGIFGYLWDSYRVAVCCCGGFECMSLFGPVLARSSADHIRSAVAA